MKKKTIKLKNGKPINSPVYQDKEGSVALAVFKNKNSKGKQYLLCQMTLLRFPFKFNQKISFPPSESERIIKILERLPELKIKETKKRVKKE